MKAIVSVLVLAMVAGSSQAITITSRPIESTGGYQSRAVTAVYDSLAAPAGAFAAAAGPIGFDDYGAAVAAPSFTLASLVFVGGVTTAGDALDFQFYNPDGTLAASTGPLALPQGGNFFWTITFGLQPDGSDSTFSVPTNGVLQIVAGPGTGRWFLTGAAPIIGTNNAAFGDGAGIATAPYHGFQLNQVPAPASLALLGLGGLVAGRRRR